MFFIFFLSFISSNFLVWMLQYQKRDFFCPQKVEKITLKSCSEFLKSTFFSLLPWLPKWPKQKNSCSKMWPIDQLYIELGMVDIACKKWFLFQVEIKTNCYWNCCQRDCFGPCTTDWATPDQLTIPLNKLPCSRRHQIERF